MGGGSSPKPGPSQGQGKPGEAGSPEQGNGGDPQARERTPEAPGEQGEKPGEPKPGGDQPKSTDQQGGDPKSPSESKGDPRNEKGGPPPGLETGRASQDRSNERWGELPETVRDLFRTEGGGELPPEYRDWIDAYYRRLNRERR